MADISRRQFNEALVSGIGASLVTASPLHPQESPAKKPNILFICADQHSGLVMGPNGHPIVRTPNLDRLAAQGVNFRNAYCGSPVCVPSRAGLMTGMFPSDVGSYCNSTHFDGRVPTWGNRLRDAGYHCWATGKLDLASGKDYGFREVHTANGHAEHPDITSLFRAPLCFRVDERRQIDGKFQERVHPDDARVKYALDFLRNEAPRQQNPWAAYVGLTLPHPSFVALPKYAEVYRPEEMALPNIPAGYLEQRHIVFQALANFKLISTPIPEARIRRARAAYFGMISELDAYIGNLLDELERSRLLDSTLVVYTSDHGEMLGEHGLWLKNNLLEGSARVPLIMAGPGLPRGRTVETPVAHVDLVATMLDLAAASTAGGLRGRSLVRLAHGQPGNHPVYAVSESHSEGNCTGSFMVRKDNWKYIYFSWYEPLLFNLKEDPGELRNLAGKPETASVQKELHGILTSLLDPDAVTARAFAEQERRLLQMARDRSADSFYKELAGRLGPGQARAITNKYYKTRSG